MKRLLLVAGLSAAVAGSAAAATVSGRVSFVTKRGQRPIVNETVVWLEPVGARPAIRRAPVNAVMTTRSKAVIPHVIAVPPGSTVSFPNEDPISHNLFSLSAGNTFDLGLYRKGSGKTQKFMTPGVVNVYCNVHPNMSAVVHVMSSPYYGFADATGAFSLDNVPAGKYELIAWNEQGGATRTTIDVPGTGAANLALTIDSRNFRAVQHLNKEGKAYKAPSTKDY